MIYCITNQKGGTGKTTTAHSLSAYLSQHGRKVLMCDLDPQANLTSGATTIPAKATMFTMLIDGTTPEASVTNICNNLDLIAGDDRLALIDTVLQGAGKEYALKQHLKPLCDMYDDIVVDTPPALSILTLNALTVADQVIITANADRYSMDGILKLYQTIGTVERYTNPDIQIAGILVTCFNSRTVAQQHALKVIDQIAEQLHTKVFKTHIRRNVSVIESQLKRTDIFSWNKSSNASKDYTDFITELLNSHT